MQSTFPYFSSHTCTSQTAFMHQPSSLDSQYRSFSLWKYVRVSQESDDFYYDSTRVLKAKEMESRKQQSLAPCFKIEVSQPKKPSRVKHRPQFLKDRRVGKKVKPRLRIGVHESSDGVILDLRQLRSKRRKLMKRQASSSSKALIPRDVNFPALLLIKNHSLAHASVKLFLRQMLDRFSDSLELIVQSNQIGCLPPPDQFIFNEESISFSDSETYVDEQDWFMDVEHQNYYIQEEPEPMDVLCVQDLRFFSEALGFSQEEQQYEDSSFIDL